MSAYQRDTKLALVRTLIQIEMADGDGKALPALREAEAIYDEDGHPYVGGGERNEGTMPSIRVSDGSDSAMLGRVPLLSEPQETPRPGERPAESHLEALPITETQTHRVVVGWTVNPGKSRSPVHREHPIGGCANCRGPR